MYLHPSHPITNTQMPGIIKVTNVSFTQSSFFLILNILETLEDGHTYQNKSESLKKRIMNYTLIQVDGIPR